MQLTEARLVELKRQLSAELWESRVQAAREEAVQMDAAVAQVERGVPAVHVVRELFPDRNEAHQVRRLRRYQARGVEALIDRRFVKPRVSRMTTEVQALVRALLTTQPELRSQQLCEAVQAGLEVEIPQSTMRQWLGSQGLSQPRGRPPEQSEVGVTALPMAGAELLKAVDEELGATRALTEAMSEELAALPEPEGPVRDDRGGRDGHGRFAAAYNQPRERSDPDLGSAFESVEQKRAGKNLSGMRVAHTSAEARHRKDQALTYLPIVVEGARWSELSHWRGQHLDTLVGHAFQPATLDKYARELKYAGVSRAMQHAVATTWTARPDIGKSSAVLLYCDAFTKPIWTRHYSRSTRVSRTGRIQPGVTTLFLHSGTGTPLLYESHSGSASLPKQIVAMLREWEEVAGAGTARRLVVFDREGHSAQLFKELDAAGWMFVVPVRRNCAKPTSRWEDVGPWGPLDPDRSDGPQVREAQLWLNDSKVKGPRDQTALRLRALTRRVDTEDPGATWVTNAAPELFTAAELLTMYSGRWAHQEHVFRDANGRVGLHRHHGYGKRKIEHIAIVDRREQLSAEERRLREQHAVVTQELSGLEESCAIQAQAVGKGEDRIRSLLGGLQGVMTHGATITEEAQEAYHSLQMWQAWLEPARQQLREHNESRQQLHARAERLLGRAEAKAEQYDDLARKTEIYTVDTDLDEIMTAFKLTFMNLASTLMQEHMQVNWQLDHLIQAVLTLPGRRRRTKTVERIEIFRQTRDPTAMKAVQRACESLNARDLRRDSRRLQFHLVDGPSNRTC